MVPYVLSKATRNVHGTRVAGSEDPMAFCYPLSPSFLHCHSGTTSIQLSKSSSSKSMSNFSENIFSLLQWLPSRRVSHASPQDIPRAGPSCQSWVKEEHSLASNLSVLGKTVALALKSVGAMLIGATLTTS